MRSPMEALDAACDHAGGQASLAEQLTAMGARVTSPAISDWRRRGVIPEDRGAPIESLTGIRADELCPQVEWLRENDAIVSYRPWPVLVGVATTPQKQRRRRA